MWVVLMMTTLVMGALALNIDIDENISSFFPSQGKETDFVMNNMKAMDKIVVMVDAASDSVDIYAAAEMFADSLGSRAGESVDISLYYDDASQDELLDYVYAHLPYLFDEADYMSLDSMTSDKRIAQKMSENRQVMMSPLGTGYMHLLPSDPLGIAFGALSKLQSIRPDENVYMQDGYMMSCDRLVMFLSLKDDFAQTGDNAKVVEDIREIVQEVEKTKGARLYAYGAPIVAVSNSTQVKRDETVTVGISLAITAIVVFMVFRRKRAILLIILPVCYGALFAFAFTSLIGVQLSLISIGTGAMVLGLAMSYSIHILTHSMHSDSIEHLIADMAYPMTVGSVTTIGAFVGLVFTDSKILQDLGIFASFALVGTLLFCLIFLPHFLVPDGRQTKSSAMRLIERVASYDYSSNKWLVGVLAVLTVVGLFYFTDVQFNADMNNLNYRGDKWIETSKEVIESSLTPDDTTHHATLVVTGRNYDELARNGEQLMHRVAQMASVTNCSSLAPYFLLSDSALQSKAERWNSYWTESKCSQVVKAIDRESANNGFATDAFDNFKHIITSRAVPSSYYEDVPSVYGEYITVKDSVMMLYVNMTMDNATKDETMDALDQSRSVVVTDMGYFVRKATSGIVDNFNYILFVSSLLVGLVLLISYRRFELFVMTFMPMCISWVIILGLMALFGVEFNVVNIILSTFIFGVGDDFSIFIMDGLQTRYRGDKDILVSHKTAIALSGFAIIVGLGVQVFAQHPACKSIGYLSIFGLVAVILTSYVVQPILFRVFISGPAQKGQPYTMKNLIRSAIYYATFFVGCVISYVVLGLLYLLPMPLRRKKQVAHFVMWAFMKFLYWFIGLSFPITNIGKVDTSSPSIIIANHQSFIDIINVLSLSPKIVCITKSWVVNSPLFGPLTKFCDFYNADEGSAEMEEKMRACMDDGYSIVIFPEGTRSDDGQIHRFHKGAFLLAERLEADITPMVIYGNGMIASKRQPLNLKDGWIVNKVLDRIPFAELTKLSYSEQSKHICQQMRHELEVIKDQYDTDSNPYYREAVLHSYVYKDSDEYWRKRREIKDPQVLHEERVKLCE